MPGWLLPALFITTTAMSFMGSMRRMQTMNTAAQWEKYNQKINTSYKTIQANERARLILSMKRAAQGARGVVIATGSTLIENNAVIDRLEDTVWWIEKGAEMDVRDIDLGIREDQFPKLLNAIPVLVKNGVQTVKKNPDKTKRLQILFHFVLIDIPVYKKKNDRTKQVVDRRRR